MTLPAITIKIISIWFRLEIVSNIGYPYYRLTTVSVTDPVNDPVYDPVYNSVYDSVYSLVYIRLPKSLIAYHSLYI